MRVAVVRLAAVALAFVLPCLPASAELRTYALQPEASSVGFHYTEGGAERLGRFERFRAVGVFDPDQPARATLTLAIETASIDLGAEIINSFAQTREWFDTTDHPEMTYALTRLTSVGPTRYLAEGTLTIKGHSLAMTTPLDLIFEPGEVRARGRLSVDRTVFDLGLGASQALVQIGRQVAVSFDLVARPLE